MWTQTTSMHNLAQRMGGPKDAPGTLALWHSSTPDLDAVTGERIKLVLSGRSPVQVPQQETSTMTA